jgi:hypothetical protein
VGISRSNFTLRIVSIWKVAGSLSRNDASMISPSRIAIRASQLDQQGRTAEAEVLDRVLQRRLAMMSGEWWITDHGVIYADGDLGDANHEMYAEEKILQDIGFDLESDNFWEGPLTLYSAKEIFREAVRNESDDDVCEYLDILKQAYASSGSPTEEDEEDEPWKSEADLEDFLRWKFTKSVAPSSAQEHHNKFNELFAGFKDPRNYALRKGWKRVRGNNIETWTFTPADREQIAHGLFEIFDEEADEYTYSVEISSSGGFYTGVSLDQIAGRESIAGEIANPEIGNRPPAPTGDPTLDRLYKYPGG